MKIIPNIIEFIEDEPLVSHIIIAEYSDNKPKSVQDLITRNIDDFKEFGDLTILNRGVVNNGKGEQPKEYFLNEQQATLLMTYLRNTQSVKEFKKELVKQFFKMRDVVKQQNEEIDSKNEKSKLDLDLILELSKKFMAMGSALGFSGYQLQNFADRGIFNETGFSPLSLTPEREFVERDFHRNSFEESGDELLSPTQIGEIMDYSAIEINNLLKRLGYQEKIDGVWRFTEKGREFAETFVFNDSSNRLVKSLRWRSRILDKL
jgi:phage regulator Rha-like protein